MSLLKRFSTLLLAASLAPALLVADSLEGGRQDGKAFGEKMGHDRGTEEGTKKGLEEGFKAGYEEARDGGGGGEPPPPPTPPEPPPSPDPDPAPSPDPDPAPSPAPDPEPDPSPAPEGGPAPSEEPPPAQLSGDAAELTWPEERDEAMPGPPARETTAIPAEGHVSVGDALAPPPVPAEEAPAAEEAADSAAPAEEKPATEESAPVAGEDSSAGSSGSGLVTLPHLGSSPALERIALSGSLKESAGEIAMREFPDLTMGQRNARASAFFDPRAPESEEEAPAVMEEEEENKDKGTGMGEAKPEESLIPGLDEEYAKGFAVGYIEGYGAAYEASYQEAYKASFPKGVAKGKAEYKRLHKSPDGDDYSSPEQLELAKKAILGGRFEEAVNRINVMLETLGGADIIAEAAYYKATAYYHWGRHQDAANTARHLVSQYPQSGFADDALFVAGAAFENMQKGGFLGLFAQRHYADALNQYQELVSRYPNSTVKAEATFRIGLNHERLGQRADAIAAYQKVVAEFPDSASAAQAKRRLARLS